MRYLSILALLFGLTCHAETIEGLVVGVVDGDTIVVLDGKKKENYIHLAGLYAPVRVLPYWQQAKDSLSELVFKREVTVEMSRVIGVRAQQSAGRVLAGGLDVNLEQLKKGLAWHYKFSEHELSPEDTKTYATAADVAKRQRLGLWQDAYPVPPWDLPKSVRHK